MVISFARIDFATHMTYSILCLEGFDQFLLQRREVDHLTVFVLQTLDMTLVVRMDIRVSEVGCQNPNELGAIDFPVCTTIAESP